MSPDRIEGIIKDSSGEQEVAAREGIEILRSLLMEFLQDEPDFTTGEVALAFSVVFPPGFLGWMLAVLIRDQVEMPTEGSSHN